MVFSPKWVGEELFAVEKVEVLVPMSPNDPVIFRKDGVAIHVDDDRVMLSVDTPSTDVFSAAEQMAHTILSTLCHTPVGAFGVNFRFSESPIPESVHPLFRYPDEPNIAIAGWGVVRKQVTRVLSKNDYTLILQLSLHDDTLTLDANFDFRVDSADSAASKLVDLTPALCSEVADLMASAYGLTMEAQVGS